MKIKMMPVSKIIPYARNPRKNDGLPVAKTKASLQEFGWQQPIVIDAQNIIIVGHTRFKAAIELGMTEVPCHIAANLTPAQVKAYRIADNKTGEFSEWDMDLLVLEFEDLKIEGFDLDLTGFAPEEVAAIESEGEPVTEGDTEPGEPRQTMAERFGIPPFSVLNAREGWWQDRKRAWIALGIKSELGRGGTASTSARVGPNDEATYSPIGGKRQRQAAAPGGSARPACDYSKKQRGDGTGKPING